MCFIWGCIFIMVCQYKRITYLAHLLENLKEKKQFTEKLKLLHQKQVFWSYVAVFPLLTYSILSIRLFDIAGLIPPFLCYFLGILTGKMLAKINYAWVQSSLVSKKY
jgi:hypothetical protein